jgi:hypothetical protein
MPFNLAEQCVVKKIVAESSPEHFSLSAESFFGYDGFSQEVQSRFSQHIEIFRGVVRLYPARVFPKTHIQAVYQFRYGICLPKSIIVCNCLPKTAHSCIAMIAGRGRFGRWAMGGASPSK